MCFFSIFYNSFASFARNPFYDTSDYSAKELTLEERDYVSLISQNKLKVYFLRCLLKL